MNIPGPENLKEDIGPEVSSRGFGCKEECEDRLTLKKQDTRGKIESWGRGIDLMRNACLDYGNPAPIFDCDSGGFGLEFPFPAVPDTEKTSVKTSVKTPVEILRLLTATPSMTLAGVAAEIGKTPRAIELATAKLVKEGRLKYVGPQKGGHWEVIV